MEVDMKKAVCLALVILMISSLFCACKNNDEKLNKDDTTLEGTSLTQESLNVDDNGYIKDNLPDNLSYNGEQVTILGWVADIDEWQSEKQNGNQVNDAIYERNADVERRLNVELNYIMEKGNGENAAQFISFVSKNVMAGESTFDVISCYSMVGASLASQNMLLNLLNYDYLDFDMPWWPSDLTEHCIINNAMYFASGDISPNLLYNMQIMVLNLDLLDSFGELEDPREFALDGTWTLDKMMSFCQNTYSDLNANSIKDGEDQFGFTSVWTPDIAAFITSSGIKSVEPTSDNMLQLTDDYTGEKMQGLLTTLCSFLHETNDAWYKEADNTQFFEGRTLLSANTPKTLMLYNDDIDYKYGILPFPKYNQSQENYYTLVGNPFSLYGILIDASEPEMSAAVIECMASESYRTVTPAVYETSFKCRYSSSEIDGAAFDIIRAGITFDYGRIYRLLLPIDLFYLFTSQLRDNNVIWASTMASYKDTINKSLETAIEKIDTK